MAPLQLRVGGIWKNTEDEILKAAVMKYGKSQWARISSLLVRKTGKQCKARWYEWLDPSIKKTEWSREEDEKLLHLAKLMPTQWRTIAPIVGRTASQCIERYHRLLDEADGQVEVEEKTIKVGDVDHEAECRPAKPDPVDMDEDEKEMLSEARARLANTQGKKAKRKAREKQLSEARRMALLKKKRELKAAGHYEKPDWRDKPIVKDMDYNREIPFYTRPEEGLFDTSLEKKFAKEEVKIGSSQNEIEGKKRDVVEEELKKKDVKRQRLLSETLMPSIDKKPHRITKPLNLPQPQVTSAQIEEIVKINSKSNSHHTLSLDGNEPTAQLLSRNSLNFEAMNDNNTIEERIATEARNQKLQSTLQTPLLGQVELMESTLHVPISATLRVTPSISRDELKINQTPFVDSFDSVKVPVLKQKSLLDALRSLPKPVGDYDIVLPEMMDSGDSVDIRFVDASDRDRRDREQREEMERVLDLNRSTAFQRNLPIPNVALEDIGDKLGVGASKEELLILEEVKLLIAVDQGDELADVLHVFSRKELDSAAELLRNEVKALREEADYDEEAIIADIDTFYRDYVYNAHTNEYCLKAEISEQYLHFNNELYESLLKKRIDYVSKRVDAKRQELNNEYASEFIREKELSRSLTKVYEKLEQADLDLHLYQHMLAKEETEIVERGERMRREVGELLRIEDELQREYAQRQSYQ